jgi:hypothetical protein
VVQLFGPENLASNVGIMLLFNGPGNFVSGPLGGALLGLTNGTSFKYVILVGGACQFLGAIIAYWARYKISPRLLAKV